MNVSRAAPFAPAAAAFPIAQRLSPQDATLIINHANAAAAP